MNSAAFVIDPRGKRSIDPEVWRLDERRPVCSPAGGSQPAGNLPANESSLLTTEDALNASICWGCSDCRIAYCLLAG